VPPSPERVASIISSSAGYGSHSLARLATFWAILLVLALLLLEGGAALTVHLLLASRTQGLLWKPDLAAAGASWSNNASNVDEELGWPSPDAATSGMRDATGAKVNADFPDPRAACLSAYGDSFIWGDDVALADGWIEQLSWQIGCRVANYGVSGYGTDQSYLRFRRMTHDKAPVVILGIFEEDIVRSVNQYRALLGWKLDPASVKGRFILDGARKLEWMPRPTLDAKRYVEMHQTPRAYLPHEYFLPDTRDGPVTVRFPYTLTLTRFAMAPQLWSRLARGQTPWADFYHPEHASGAVPLTIAIAQAFIQEAERRDARAFIVMMPGAGDFRSHQRLGASEYFPFVAAMEANGLSVFDPIPALIAALGGRSYCMLYVRESVCQGNAGMAAGHYSVAGGSLLAEVVAAELRRRNLLTSR
jgi:hypothetical protein